MVNIIIGGDICPTGRVSESFEEETVITRFNKIKDVLEKADFKILNLETPLLKGGFVFSPILKSGPNLQCPSSSVSILSYLGIDMVTLANNHILDYGENGLNSTIETLTEKKIEHIGVGCNIEEASKVKILEVNGIQFGFINCCEEEYSIATVNKAGAMPLRTIDVFHAIKKIKKDVDYVILITHGGAEHFQLPTPDMKKRYRFFIEAGADVIVNHHQHCYSGFEEMDGKLIFYGLGNFCFDNDSKRNNIWNEGYLVNLSFSKSKSIQYELIPYIQNDKKVGVFPMNVEQQLDFTKTIDKLNFIINDDKLLNAEYQIFLDKTYTDYLDIITPYSNRYLRALYRRGFLPSFFPDKKCFVLRDVVTCIAHRERFIDFLKRKTNKK